MATGRSEDLALAIAGELGPDVSYKRAASDRPEDQRYLTGIEVGIILGTAALTSFCVGFVKGFAERIGSELGKAAAAATMHRLSQIRDKVRGIEIGDAEAAKATARRQQAALDEVIASDFPRFVSVEELPTWLMAAGEEERREVEELLLQSGFPEATASAHAVRIVALIQRDLSIP